MAEGDLSVLMAEGGLGVEEVVDESGCLEPFFYDEAEVVEVVVGMLCMLGAVLMFLKSFLFFIYVLLLPCFCRPASVISIGSFFWYYHGYAWCPCSFSFSLKSS